VLVEVDGWAYHRDLPAFRRDQERQNALVLAGWTVLRVNWHDLEADPDGVLATVRAATAAVA
jgi:very-short-patch-repair endonuclease